MNTWHATSEELEVYRYGAGDPAVTASIEAHLLACPQCQHDLATLGGTNASAETARRWTQLTELIDVPRTSALPRITLSTRPLLTAWLVATALVFVIPLLPVLITGEAVPTLLLAMAPLAPIAAVATAYRTSSDPAGELALSTPMAGLRTVAGRALLVGLAAAPFGILAAILLHLPAGVAFAWLLPGLALSSVVLLAGTTRIDPTLVAGVLGVGWPIVAALPWATRRMPVSLAADWIAAPDVQLLMLAVASLSLMAAVARRDRVTYRRTT